MEASENTREAKKVCRGFIVRKTLTLLISVALILELLAVPGIPSLVATAEAAGGETVLYEQNFDSYELKEGANDNGWYLYKANAASTTTAVIEDGKLVFDAHSSGYDAVYLNNGAQWSNYTLEADVTYLKVTGWFGLTYNVTNGNNWQRVGLSLSGGSNTAPGRWAINGRLNGAWNPDNKGNYDTSAISGGDTLRFKVVSNGANTTFSYAPYNDGVLGEWIEVRSATNIPESGQSGSIGLMAGSGNNNTKVALDNIVVTSNTDSAVLYSEDFSTTYTMIGSAEGTANDFGFTFLTSSAKSTAVVKDGGLYLTRGSAGIYPRVWVTSGNYSDYVVEADITYLTDSSWAGLMFNVVDGKNFFNGKVTISEKISINGYTNGFNTYDVSGINRGFTYSSRAIDVGQTVRHKIATKDNVATLYIAFYDNGILGEYEQVLSISNIPDTMCSGSVGFVLANASTSVVVDNLKVTANAHDCTWAEEWTTNDTYHWHMCTDSTCQLTSSPENHGYTDEDDITCDTCGYTRNVTVVYQENFDSYTVPVTLSNGVNYDTGWIYSQNAGGSAVIKDGKLYFSGSGYDVIYRDGGQTWGNYTLEADIGYNSGHAGWGGMLYNVQSATKFQKAGIYSGSGKISLNGYDGGWTNNTSGINSASYANYGITFSEQETVYRFKVVVENQSATLYYAAYDAAGNLGQWVKTLEISNIPADAQTGSIGFMTSNGNEADYWVDNILVTETSHVVFAENFDGVNDTALIGNNMNSNLGLNFVKVSDGATAEIKNGKLLLTGANCDVVTFETGKSWTNYTVEADVSYAAATSGWGGMLFRSTDDKTFQKAAVTLGDRSNINGKLNGSWHNDKEGVTKVNFANDLTVGEEYRMKVVVEEGTATLYYARYTNGVLGSYETVMSVSNTFAKEHMTGTIGLLVGSSDGTKVCSMTLDNIVVSRGADRFQQAPVYNVAEVYVPETGIVNPPVVIQQITNALPATTVGPAVALMEIDENLNILGSEGQTIATATQFDEQCSAKVIPAYIIDSTEEAAALSQFLADNDIVDAFVVSANADLIYQVRTANDTGKCVRGVLICDNLSTAAAKKAAYRTANDCLANVLLCDQELTVEDMGFFNARDIAVWSTAADAAGVYAAVAAGYSAVVVIDPAVAYSVYSGITTNTVSGEPVIIAHRGHTYYPENTILGFQKAMEAGCLAVEIDVKLSKDGQLVLMHDGTVDRTTAKSGNVGTFTAEELVQTVVDDISYNEVDITDANGVQHMEWVTVPTLKSVFDHFKDTDLMFYCHMNKTTATVEAFNELMKDYEDMKDQVIFFVSWTYMESANYTNVTDGIAFAAGDRSEVILGDTNDLICIENFVRGCTPYNYQPVFYNYTYNGHSREDFYYEMAARGYVNIHSTTNGQSTMDTRFLTDVGIIGALTDNVYLTSNYSYYVDATDQTLNVGETLDFVQTVLRVDPMCNVEVECGFVQLSGPTLIASGEGYTLSEPGVVTLVYYADTTGGNVSYRVYSTPVTVTFVEHMVDTNR